MMKIVHNSVDRRGCRQAPYASHCRDSKQIQGTRRMFGRRAFVRDLWRKPVHNLGRIGPGPMSAREFAGNSQHRNLTNGPSGRSFNQLTSQPIG
jgi:hypothetical protein